MYSVIIPVYNGENSLEAAVLSALGQTLPPQEILILNDCSTDGTKKLAESLAERYPCVKVYNNPKNEGVAATRNKGFLLAEEEYVALLDADDRWRPDKLALQLEQMEHTGCDFCYTGYALYQEGKEVRRYEVPERVTFAELLAENVIGCSTVVLTKEIARTYTMSPDYAHEDYVLWLELLREGKSARGISSVQMEYEVSPHSRSGDKGKAGRGRWRIYRKFLGMNVFSATIAFMRYAMRGIRKHYL